MENINLTIVVADLVPASTMQVELANLPALNKLLAANNKQVSAQSSIEGLLLALFQQSHLEKPAYAAINALGDNLPAADKTWWLRTDPLALQVGNAKIFIAENQHLLSTMAEAEAIVAELNEFLAADGLQIIAVRPQAWYLHLKQDPQITSAPLFQVIGKNMYDYLPLGERKLYWRRLLTELQMVLYTSKFNQQRQAQGLATVDSLWFWGEGSLPQPTTTNWRQVSVSNAFGRGLALLTDTVVNEVPEDFSGWWQPSMPAGEYLIVIEMEQSWQNQLALPATLLALEKSWFKPMLKALYAKQLTSIKLYGSFDSYYHMKKSWWKF